MTSLLASKPMVHVGERFGRLQVIGTAFYIRPTVGQRHRKQHVVCLCDCGCAGVHSSNMLRAGKAKSCGCLKSEITSTRSTTHGLSATHFYNIWASMVQRCESPEHTYYPRYGGRGISVCDEWRGNPEAFCQWCSENGHARGLQIDRINNDGNYEPGNCRLVSSKLNNRNRNNNRILTADGKSQCMAAWSEERGILPSTICYRLKAGWSEQDAVTTPVNREER